MHKELEVEIISPTGYLFKGQCHLATIPASDGDMGIMNSHETILTNLKEGKVVIFDNRDNIIKECEVKSGFAEMFDNRLLVLID
ncbi:MAG: F0F1-type ATP synthase epsilon subunit [Rickettsiales bacterium]|jgi:F0F1-type ATP synthase epsilon subunit